MKRMGFVLLAVLALGLVGCQKPVASRLPKGQASLPLAGKTVAMLPPPKNDIDDKGTAGYMLESLHETGCTSPGKDEKPDITIIPTNSGCQVFMNGYIVMSVHYADAGVNAFSNYESD